MALLKWLIGAGAAFGGLVALMYVAQRSLMYFPERLHTPPAIAGLPEAQEVVLDTKDGERVIVWHVPPRGEKPIVLYFHGNGGALRNRVALSCAHCRWERTHRAQLPRIRWFDRTPDRSWVDRRRGGGLCLRRRALSRRADRAMGRVSRLRRRGCTWRRSQGWPHRTGRVLHVGCRCGRGARLSVFATAAFDEGPISLRSANRRGDRPAAVPARRA